MGRIGCSSLNDDRPSLGAVNPSDSCCAGAIGQLDLLKKEGQTRKNALFVVMLSSRAICISKYQDYKNPLRGPGFSATTKSELPNGRRNPEVIILFSIRLKRSSSSLIQPGR